MWETLANISSIITLILFMGAIIGKIIILGLSRRRNSEKIDIIITNNAEKLQEYKIVETIVPDTDKCCEYLIITLINQSYNWVKLYKYDLNSRHTIGKPVATLKDIRINQSIAVNTIVTCAAPNYIIKFRREDNMIGEIPLCYNGKNGVQEQLVNMRHNFLSIIYYILFK